MNNLSMAGGVASPLHGVVGKVYGFIVLDHPSAHSLSVSFIIKIFARCFSSVKTSAHTNDGPMPDKTIDLSTEECEGIMHRDHHLQLRSIAI